MKKSLVVICDDQARFIEEFKQRHGGYYEIVAVDDTRKLPEELEKMKYLPDILLLDLYHPRDNNSDFEQRRLAAEDRLTALDEEIEKTKEAVNRTWEPFGIEMLKVLREKYLPEQLPIAIYTQKGILLLEDKELQEVETLNAHWLLKKRLTARTEEVRIDRIISYWKKPSSNELEVNKKVFIVHGHDEFNKYQLRTLLKERFNLEPIILSELPSKGRTIIQKLEEEAGRASYAFALLTPDDLVKSPEQYYLQARPNVMIEIGWFYGRLGREKVCLLHKENTDIPSDLQGVNHISFSNHIEEKVLEIERELREAALVV
jgi:hypothetical protein